VSVTPDYYREIVIAELTLRAAQHRLRAAKLKYDVPGEGVHAKGRRFRDYSRNFHLSAEYTAVIEELSK
jgi:hypothetical protein